MTSSQDGNGADTHLEPRWDVPGDGNALRILGLRVAFGGVHALRGVSLDARQGDVVAIIGSNGAGKSTLLNAVNGIVRVAGGTIECYQRDVTGRSPSLMASYGVGRSFQLPRLIDGVSVVENVRCGGHLMLRHGAIRQLIRPRQAKAAEAKLTARALALLDLVGLGASADLLPGSMPYGSRKLVDVARALVPGPRLLLLDEPSSGLAQSEISTVANLIRRFAQPRKMTIVLVEHHMDLVRSVADTVVAMAGGEILAIGEPGAVLDSPALRSAFTGADVNLRG
jgi:branched-chain amino acid transport system ATP-binding protein